MSDTDTSGWDASKGQEKLGCHTSFHERSENLDRENLYHEALWDGQFEDASESSKIIWIWKLFIIL